MSSSLSPPGATEEVRAGSALVLAPHYDDEVLGCGGLLAHLTGAGAAVRVLFLSDSSGWPEGAGDDSDAEDRAAYGQRRRQEATAAAEVLGIAGVDHLALPDGALDQHQGTIASKLRRALISQRPALLLTPSPIEASPDHRAAFAAVHQLLGGLRPGDALWPLVQDLEVLAYEVNHPLRPNLLVDVGEQLETIERAMACYASQQEQHDYLGACLGLARFRALTLPPEVDAAEAYRRLTLGDLRTRGPAALAAEIGGAPATLVAREGPKISVIVRTRDRPELLAEALASLGLSTYRRFEVVLVNDGGAVPAVPDDLPIPVEVVNLETNRGRAAAANAGIAAATGDYACFLDDDDLVEPEHLATLAGLVKAAGVRVAYTDAAVGVYRLDGEDGWRCTERRLPYSRDFDPELLLFDNYIPFNTLLIERRLFDEVGALDEELPFFEDWDFLIRLAALTPFHHLARVTCEYRHFRGGGHHILGDRPGERSDFLEMKARVIAKHAGLGSAATIARAVDRLRAEAVTENEAVSRLRGELATARDDGARGEERYHRLNGQVAGLEVHQQVIEESERLAKVELRQRADEVVALKQHARELEGYVRQLEGQIGEQSATLQQTYDEVERLTGEIRQQSATLQQTYDEVERLTGDVGQQSATLQQTYDEATRLTGVIRAMESTRAWRAHQWWQRRRSGRRS